MANYYSIDPHYLTYIFLLKKFARMYFLSSGVKGLTIGHIKPQYSHVALGIADSWDHSPEYTKVAFSRFYC